MTKIRSEACSACPYLRSTPSGVWDAAEYDKLREYDELTGDQPLIPFACHATPTKYCNGWVVTHSHRGHQYELLALRLVPHEPVPDADPERYYASGNEAADAGQADIEQPTEEAAETIDRLLRKYPRLQR